jgi:23S rRNA pseudouridine1911/1915/1917 synthase
LIRRLRLVTTEAHRGQRLDALLGVWLPAVLDRALSRGAVRRLILAGAVRVAGRPCRRPAQALRPGLPIDAAVDTARLFAREVPRRAPDIGVLYEDAALIAVDKPAGLPVHATADPRRPNLFDLVRRRLGGGPEPYLGLHHRLDRDTSGVVLFTKDPRANRALAERFATRRVVKVYHALTRRPSRAPPAAWTSRAALEASDQGRAARVRATAPGEGLEARTDFRLLSAFARGQLVEARPRTGRKHQIRAHLALLGMPVLGDRLYGSPPPSAGPTPARTMLHALRLELPHPLTDEPLRIESPYPEDFRGLLEALRNEAPRPGGSARGRPR